MIVIDYNQVAIATFVLIVLALAMSLVKLLLLVTTGTTGDEKYFHSTRHIVRKIEQSQTLIGVLYLMRCLLYEMS